MSESVIVWTGSRFDEWDYYKTKELGIPSYAREATPQEASLYREHKAALRAFAEREKELVEALEPFADFFDWSEKGAPARGGLRKTDFAKARAIIDKHKEKSS
jgi:hypothetical protein